MRLENGSHSYFTTGKKYYITHFDHIRSRGSRGGETNLTASGHLTHRWGSNPVHIVPKPCRTSLADAQGNGQPIAIARFEEHQKSAIAKQIGRASCRERV